MIGIYTITCISNKRIYVGQSKDFLKRKKEHLTKLSKGTHENIHLQRAYNKYGEEDFVWNFEDCQVEFLTEIEQFYLDNYNSDNLFNINMNASVPPIRNKTGKGTGKKTGKTWNKGIPVTDEVKRKISASNKGRKMPQSQREATSRRMIGAPQMTTETFRKMSDKKKALSDDQCKEVYLKYKSGLSQQKIANEYNCDRMSIRTALKYYNNYLITHN